VRLLRSEVECTMRLSQLVISNFCSCDALTVPLSTFNPIIGYNNSGKSNVLRATHWLLRKSVLPRRTFHNPAQGVTVEGTIEQVNLGLLPPNQQNQVAPYVSGGMLRFRRRQDAPDCAAAQVKIEVLNPVTNVWATNPTGLDNAIGVLFPEPLYIEAMEDVGQDVGKFAAKNTLGLLLKYLTEQLRANNQAALQNIEHALQVVASHLNGPNRAVEIGNFEASASAAISSFFPDLALHLDLPAPGLDELFKSAGVALSDLSGTRRPFESYGHGAQRSVHMALIKLLADWADQAHGSTVVLLIDEPELYLHPQAIELLREALKHLSQQNFQVVFSTHSPLLIARDDVLNTLVLYKDLAHKTQVRTKLAHATQVLANHQHQAGVLFSLQNATYLLFSERVLLVEGKAETMLLPHIFEVMRGHSLGRAKRCIVEGSSSTSIAPMMQVLASVGFTAQALVDLDFGFRIAPSAGLIDPGSAAWGTCMHWFGTDGVAQGITLDASGLPARRGANGIPGPIAPEEAFERLAAARPAEVRELADNLLAHGIWMWTRGAFEAHLGIAKNDAARLEFLTDLRAHGNLDHAAHPQEIAALIEWL
jgi:putative ATP-dependent endonuclease of the OLD family